MRAGESEMGGKEGRSDNNTLCLSVDEGSNTVEKVNYHTLADRYF